MADDEFDIDIYGDTNTEEGGPFKKDEEGDVKIEGIDGATDENNETKPEEEQDDDYIQIKVGNEDPKETSVNGQQQQIKSTDESGQDVLSIPKQAPQQQGVKRKMEGPDDRPVDPGATTALLISELHWWNTDDDVRGWVNQAQVEDELKEITFSEHKVNGKSKGQAYIEFTSQQAATAATHKIDAFGEGQQYLKKHSVTYSNSSVNPFRTLPKDAPMRSGKEGQSNRGGSSNYNNDRSNQNSSNYGGNFRGRTPGYNASRGGMNNHMNHNNFNRNFSGPAMSNIGGGFIPQMDGFQGNPMGGQFGGFNRGGMMGGMRGGHNMRGGRGGMGNGMMGGMSMGGMPMGGMAGGMGGMPMNMGHMGGAMQGMTNPPANGQPLAGGQNVVGKADTSGSNVGHSSGPYMPRRPEHQSLLPQANLPNKPPPSLGYTAHQSTYNPSYPKLFPSQGCRAEQAKQKSYPAGAGGFQGQMPHFNPAFFQQNQAAGGDWQNPHPAKRPRPE